MIFMRTSCSAGGPRNIQLCKLFEKAAHHASLIHHVPLNFVTTWSATIITLLGLVKLCSKFPTLFYSFIPKF